MIRRATVDDVGRIAYFMLKWDSELPSHLKATNGDSKYVEQVAHFIVNDHRYHTYVYEQNKEVIGIYCFSLLDDLLVNYNVASLFMWYVLPRCRSGLVGLKLLTDAITRAKDLGAGRVDVFPWADHKAASRILERLGGCHLTNIYSFFS
jgi:hypothetical protein